MQRIVAILVIVVGGWGGSAFAHSVYIYGGDFNLPIPKPDSNDPNISKGWMDDAIIEITDNILISDLDVGISLTHTNVFDLQIFLQSPFETKICLNMYDVEKEFSVYPDYTNTIFDDEAQESIKQAEPPFTGRFKPKSGSLLEVFDGQDAYGFWHLRIYDAFHYDTGTLDSFELIITIPEPATAIILTLGVVLMRLHKRRRNR